MRVRFTTPMDGTRNRGDDPSAESFTVRERPGGAGSLASAPLFTPGTVLAERYELRRILGRGGMGVVFEAYDRILADLVAIKIVRAEYAGDRAWAERLAREVKLARQINHPSVCRVFDFGQADAHPFLIMELAGRGTLRDEIVRGEIESRPLAERVSDARTLASGLAAIHAAGIVHRDIAPQNALRMDDGRLMLSDFGLAVDNFDTSSSLHGGTVAYMAPELVRGARATFASDIWSLGIVIHEAVFGVRPRWSGNAREILEPKGQRLAGAARAVFEVCRDCTAPDPLRRKATAATVAARLDRVFQFRFGGRRARDLSLVAAVIGAGVLFVPRLHHPRAASQSVRRASAAGDSFTLVPTGQPEDWSDRSRVLLEVPDRVECMRALPGGKSVRFVYGHPSRAEDVNVRTGQRVPSPLVPEAFAEGCPDVTADGRRLLFAGHTKDARPFVFVSEHPDGRDAVPVVPMAEPTMSSEPEWLIDGDTFVYDADTKHAAAYSLATKQNAVLSTQDDRCFTFFHSVAGQRLAISKIRNDLTSEVHIFASPSLEQDLEFSIDVGVLDARSPDGRTLYLTNGPDGRASPIIVVDTQTGTARKGGFIPEQLLRRLVFLSDSIAFWSVSHSSVVSLKDGGQFRVENGIGTVAACGPEILASRYGTEHRDLVRFARDGRLIGSLPVEGTAHEPRCSADGSILYYIDLAANRALRRCVQGKCDTLSEGVYTYGISPRGDRVAMTKLRNAGAIVTWVDADRPAAVHEANNNTTACSPVWDGPERLWVSVRKGGGYLWTELDTFSGKLTGRSVRGVHDCSTGMDDPAAPVRPEVWVDFSIRSQLRLMPRG